MIIMTKLESWLKPIKVIGLLPFSNGKIRKDIKQPRQAAPPRTPNNAHLT